MPAVKPNSYERRLAVPFVLLLLALLALLVSLLGLARTASITAVRMDELQVSWQAVQDGSVEGSELVATNRLMNRAKVPVPAVQSAAQWSLGLTLVSLALLAWVVVVARRANRSNVAAKQGRDNHEQAAVLKLMDEIAPLASGDLRVRASVSDTLAGSLADAFNYAVSELRWLVGTMRHSALQVTESVERSRESAKVVARACAEQSGEIHRSSNFLLSMSGTMAELSADAADSSVAAQAAVEQAEHGVHALEASLNRLSAIRDEADRTTRLMNRLADNVSAIDDRVSVVEEVAKRTDLLALNTTIRASAGSSSSSVTSAAADLGQLSDEVSQLAEVLGQATRDIGSLTRTISQDAADTVQSMEHTTAQLVIGMEQTSAANIALTAIHRDSLSLRECIVTMADKTVKQSGVVRELTANMDAINRITSQTAEGVKTNAESLNDLQELAGELRQSLSDFRLPAKPSNNSDVPSRFGMGRDTSASDSGAVTQAPSKARQAANRAVIHE